MSTTASTLPNARFALLTLVTDRLRQTTGEALTDFILARRQPGSEVPYRHIASELVALTGVDMTHEAVRRWYMAAIEPAAEAGAEDGGRA